MRERVTFVHRQGAGIDPDELQVQAAGLLGPQTEVARQDRLTLALDDLPPEIADLLRGFEELHLRWASPLAYHTLDPFSSRLSPGLHLSCTPRTGAVLDTADLCSFLQLFGPLDCLSRNAFTKLKPGQSLGSPALYFYQELEDLNGLVKKVADDVCPELDPICQARARSLYNAASLDISFDAVSEALTLTAFWPLLQQSITVPASSVRRTEVGVLGQDVPPSLEPHELGISGLLTVLGDKKKPSPTLFSFPSRHRLSDGHFTSKFQLPFGLHPTLQLSLTAAQPPVEDSSCAPYAYLTLPKTIFADRYQLADELFLASKNLTASPYTSLPVDLEAPAYTTETWGSNVLLELAPPAFAKMDTWTAEVPLHLRYLKPSATGKVPIEIPYPAVFWACPSQASVKFADNPFDRVNLGYDGLFDADTTFWHLTPEPDAGDRIMSPITVPVLKEAGASWVEFGTGAAVALGFAWVLWTLANVYMKAGYGSSQSKDQRRKKEE